MTSKMSYLTTNVCAMDWVSKLGKQRSCDNTQSLETFQLPVWEPTNRINTYCRLRGVGQIDSEY